MVVPDPGLYSRTREGKAWGRGGKMGGECQRFVGGGSGVAVAIGGGVRSDLCCEFAGRCPRRARLG